MWLNTLRFISLLFTALALGAGLAHVLQMINKMNLSAGDYLTVQKMYRGWALLGVVVVISFLSTLIITIKSYRNKKEFVLLLSALLCIISTQLIFWIFTYPVNVETKNWTLLTANWLELRDRWEYSHMTGALLNLFAVILLIISVLQRK